MSDADVRWLQRLENYERALATLERALTLAASRPLSELEQQGLIQAFEFTHELSWLLLKDFLVDQGVSGISGSRDAVRQAVERELLPAGIPSCCASSKYRCPSGGWPGRNGLAPPVNSKRGALPAR